MKKNALYPFAVGAADFKVGSLVKKMLGNSNSSSFVGTVVAVNPSIEKVDVLWPTGIIREDPEWLIPINDYQGIIPSIKISNVAANYLKRLSVVYKLASTFRSLGHNEVFTYDTLSQAHGDSISDEAIRDVVLAAFQDKIAENNRNFIAALEEVNWKKT